MDKYISYINPKQNIRGFLIGIIILGGLGLAVGAAVVNNSPDEAEVQEEITDERFSSPNVLVYAYWAGENSEIKTFDLSTGEDRLLATLPLNIKHVKLLSPSEIIYINDTDDNDYGSQIVVKNISNDQERIVVEASEGVRIDDYRVSPNGQYVATWEVALSPESEQLYNGTSRVYATDINSGVKNQIVSETADAPVHYPVAVGGDGRVFMDTFLPNDSAGWAYGMSVSDFSGSDIQEIESMANGTYGSQPVLSPDGTQLVFTGYNGANGDGTELVSGTRRAVISANTVDVLDLDTLSRRVLPNLSQDNYYSKAWWDEISGNVLISTVSTEAERTGTYSYHLGSGIFEKVDIESLNNATNKPNKVISVLNPGIVLTGNVTVEESTLGNLGSQYEQTLNGVNIVNQNEEDIISLDIVGGFVQPLTVKPTSYFDTGFASAAQSDSDSGGVQDQGREQLQFQTFTIKPTLAPKRINQQSGDRCRDVAVEACNSILETSYTSQDALDAKVSGHEDREFVQCIKEQWSAARSANCSDSPLYLYGEKGKNVNVKVGTNVTESKAPYSPQEGFRGTLTGDGIVIDDNSYSSIEFDYELAADYVEPSRGVIVERSNMDEELNNYAEKLGMNDKETYDFIKYIKAETSSDEIFISHFSNQVSKKLLPLYFTPEPDSYTNIVFYVNDGGAFPESPEPPNYKGIKRDGFSAVEISYIISN